MSEKPHQQVWQKATGRRLKQGWVIHHLNGNHEDNSPENLVALPKEVHDNLIQAQEAAYWGELMLKRFNMLLSDLEKEQKNKRIRSLKGRVRWVCSEGRLTTLEEIERMLPRFVEIQKATSGMK